MQDSLPVPEDGRLIVAAAQAAQAKGDLETAAKLFREAVSASPDKKSVIFFSADGLRECGHWTEAVTLLEDASRRWPVSAGILSRLSQIYFEAQDFSRAADCLRRYLAHDPREIDFWRQLGGLYLRAHEFHSAIDAFDHVLATEPLNVDASVGKGEALWELGRAEEALAAYRRAETIEPGNSKVLGVLGHAVLRAGSPVEAAHLLQRALQAGGPNSAVYSRLSFALSAVGQFDSAAEAARDALMGEPTSVAANHALGLASIGKGEFGVAAESLRLAANADPGNIDVLFALADAEAFRDEPFAAERALQQILTIEPDNAFARFMLAALHGEALASPPADFSRSTFDRAAAGYDDRFSEDAGYRAPIEAAKEIEDTLPELCEFKRLADLGCGTGLATAALRDAFRIDHATGIDVSPRMIEIASRKDLYDQLIVGDAAASLESLNEEFDLISAIELAPYVGNLSAVLKLVGERLTPGGIFVCSIEQSDAASLTLKKTRRFAHNPEHVKSLAEVAGLEFISGRAAIIPSRSGAPEAIQLLLFRRVR